MVIQVLSPDSKELEFPFHPSRKEKGLFLSRVTFYCDGSFYCMIRFNNVPIQHKNAKVVVKR
jgi:hypothetical protein